MLLILKEIYKFYYDYVGQKYEPRIDHMPMMGSPWKMISLLLLYLYFVKIKGPQLMKNREPFDLNNIMIFYNGFQVIANLLLGSYVVYRMFFVYDDIDLGCLLVDFTSSVRGLDEVMVTYLYFLLKLLDLLDTVFFVLRKKYNQITFLHVYHHTLMCIAIYIACRYYPAGHGGIMGLVNTFVHVFMYSYYFCTAFNPQLKNSLWWKKYITQVQMFQFAILIIHFLRPIINGNCKYPFFILMSCMIQNVFMLALFTDFYIKAYVRKSIKQK